MPRQRPDLSPVKSGVETVRFGASCRDEKKRAVPDRGRCAHITVRCCAETVQRHVRQTTRKLRNHTEAAITVAPGVALARMGVATGKSRQPPPNRHSRDRNDGTGPPCSHKTGSSNPQNQPWAGRGLPPHRDAPPGQGWAYPPWRCRRRRVVLRAGAAVRSGFVWRLWGDSRCGFAGVVPGALPAQPGEAGRPAACCDDLQVPPAMLVQTVPQSRAGRLRWRRRAAGVVHVWRRPVCRRVIPA